MDRYVPNFVLIILMTSMILFIMSGIATDEKLSLGFLISGWVGFFLGIIIKLIKNIKR